MSITNVMTGGAKVQASEGAFGGDIDNLIRNWARDTADRLLAESKKRDFNFDSLTYRINEGDTPSITFEFPVHGAYMDMKFLFWTSMPNLDKIESWVRSKPASEWAYVPGYKGRNGISDVPYDTAVKRIAFGVAKSMASGEPRNNWAKYKRKRIWQQPRVGKAVAHLSKLLQEELAAISTEAVITPLIKR